MPRQYRSPRTQLIKASGLGLKKSEDDVDQERWSVPGIWLDLRNAPNKHSDVVTIISLWIIRSKRGQGHAGRVMSALCAAADALGIRLRLEAHAYGRGPLSTAELVVWYSRYGFRHTRGGTPDRVPMERAVGAQATGRRKAA